MTDNLPEVEREVVATFGPVMDVEVIDSEGRVLDILSMGRLSHGPEAGRLVVCVAAHFDEKSIDD